MIMRKLGSNLWTIELLPGNREDIEKRLALLDIPLATAAVVVDQFTGPIPKVCAMRMDELRLILVSELLPMPDLVGRMLQMVEMVLQAEYRVTVSGGAVEHPAITDMQKVSTLTLKDFGYERTGQIRNEA